MFKRSTFIACFYAICSLITANLPAKPNHFNQGNNENSSTQNAKQISVSEAQQELLEELLANLREQLQNIIFCIQQTEQVLAKNKIKLRKSQSDKIKQELGTIKDILQAAYQQGLSSADIQSIEQASHIVVAITLYLEKAFLDIKNISAQKLIEAIQESSKKIQANQGRSINLEDLAKRIAACKKHVEKLIKQAETLGLTKLNLRWRSFADSKWTSKAMFYSKYITLGAMAYVSSLLLLHPEMKIGPWQIKDLRKQIGIGTTNCPLYQEMRDRQKRLAIEDHTASLSGKPFKYEPKPISTIDGILLGVKNIASIPGILLVLCSPLTSYAKMAYAKAFGLVDTTQDCAQLEKWASQKYKNAVAYLRGETTYKYIGTENLADKDSGEETTTLEDIVGGELLKEIAIELIDYVKNPKKYEQAGIRAEAGILLHGPPQTGKTMFARALQTELERQIPGEKVCFLPVSNKDLEQFSIEDIFYLAKTNAPCIVFFDEIDMIGASRNSANPTRTRELLTSLSKVMEAKTSKKVFVIGATNEPENMDFALLVKGRFGIEIPLDYPIYKNRLAFITRELDKRGVRNVSKEFIDRFAQETEGRSYNELSAVINDAFARSMRELRMITQEDFARAFDNQLRGILPMKPLTEKELQIISTYQIGLGLMRTILRTQNKVNCLTTCPVKLKIKYNESSMSFTETNNSKNTNSKLLTKGIKPLTTSGHTFTTNLGNNTTFLSDEEIKNETIVLLAGQAALKLITGNYYSEYMKVDNAECLNRIKDLISQGEENSENIVKKALEIKSQYAQEALDLLAPYKEDIIKLAETLTDKKVIRAEEWEKLVQETFSKESNNSEITTA